MHASTGLVSLLCYMPALASTQVPLRCLVGRQESQSLHAKAPAVSSYVESAALAYGQRCGAGLLDLASPPCPHLPRCSYLMWRALRWSHHLVVLKCPSSRQEGPWQQGPGPIKSASLLGARHNTRAVRAGKLLEMVTSQPPHA